MEDLGGNGPGNVYVFNVYGQDMVLSLNGLGTSGGTIPGWNATYQPGCQAVPRTFNASDGPGKFFSGRNLLTIAWYDGLFTAQVAIDGSQFPLIQNLLLFIAGNGWQLINQYGAQVATGIVTAAMGSDAPDEAVC